MSTVMKENSIATFQVSIVSAFSRCPTGRGCPFPPGLDLLPGVGRVGGSLSSPFRCLASLSRHLSIDCDVLILFGSFTSHATVHPDLSSDCKRKKRDE